MQIKQDWYFNIAISRQLRSIFRQFKDYFIFSRAQFIDIFWWEYFRVQLSNILLSSTNININSMDARIYSILSASSLRNQRNKRTI